jgi:hypothetical protein
MRGSSDAHRHPHARARRLLIGLVLVAAAIIGPGAAIALGKPVDNVRPEVVGHAKIGERLVCYAGSWSGNAPHFEYEWIRGGLPVSSGVTYTLSAADEGEEVWCVVTGIEGSEREEVESSNGVTIPGKKQPYEPPEVITAPEVSGKAEVGSTLSCSHGTWSGNPAPSFSYKWLRDKEPISEATASTYTVSGEDGGNAISCRVTASNEVSSASAESSNSLVIAGSLPKDRGVPDVLGTPEVGQPLTCGEGEWEGTEPLTFKFQWLRDGSAIAMATGSIYFVEVADEGQSLSCKVTATNSVGSSAAASAPVVVPRAAPTNTQPPEIIGSPKVGAILTCSRGTWTGSPTEYEYEWLQESKPLVGSNKSTHTVAEGDRGHTLYCGVTAKNSGGETYRQSGPLVIPSESGGAAPEPIGKPVISGAAQAGAVLTCLPEAWDNNPIEFLYQWVRDAELPSKVSIESGTAAEYEVSVADEGHSLSCRVTALNHAGSATAQSEPLGVEGEKPTSTAPGPEISGKAHVGETLTCLPGKWDGAPAPELTFQWQRDGVSIATGFAYTIVAADRGHALSCVVTATNSEGTAIAQSSPLYVPGSPPEGEAPTIHGSAEVGATLTCSEGKWTGAPQPTLAYQWLLDGVASPSATTSTFTVSALDRGLLISCRITASSREGTVSVTSKSIHIVGLKPEMLEAPQVSGTAALGATLTCERGIWKGAPPPSFTYQWFRDGTALSAATASTYTVESADVGHLLSCNVIAANLEGKVEVESRNGLAIPVSVAPNVETHIAVVAPVESSPVPLSATVILAALRQELTRAQQGLRLSAVLKSGGFTFSFTAPSAGKLELLWDVSPKAAHGSAKKSKPLIIGRSSMAFNAPPLKRTLHLKLTSTGRKELTGKKQVKLAVTAVFLGSAGKPVTWTGTLVLSH